MHETVEKETDLATEVFLRAYDKLEKIHDEVARVSATNGILIHLEKGGSFSRLRAYEAEKKIKEDKMSLGQKLCEIGMPAKTETKEEPKPETETPVAEKQESLSDMGEAGVQKQRILELENNLVPQPKTFEVETPVPQKDGGLPEYDAEAKRWNYCAKHPKHGINYHASGDLNEPYQACFKCREFLNSDGKRTPMKKVKKDDE
jgi:hypothetical protein